jgi:hypothetical protein
MGDGVRNRETAINGSKSEMGGQGRNEIKVSDLGGLKNIGL